MILKYVVGKIRLLQEASLDKWFSTKIKDFREDLQTISSYGTGLQILTSWRSQFLPEHEGRKSGLQYSAS